LKAIFRFIVPMIKKLLFLFLFAFSTPVLAQQIPHFSQYFFNGGLRNPAYLNNPNYAEVSLFYRSQWTGFAGTPITQGAILNTPLRREQLSFGLNFLRSTQGPISITHTRTSFGYRFQQNKRSVISLGLSLGFIQYRFDTNQLNLRDDLGIDPVFSNLENSSSPDIGVGAMYKTCKYLVGFSIQHLLPVTIGGEAKLARHYNLMASYELLDYNNVQLEGSTLVKVVRGTRPQADLNLRLTVSDILWMGTSYRTEDALALMAGVILLNGRASNQYLRIGYSYNYTTSNLGLFNSGSHEILLSYGIRMRSAIQCQNSLIKMNCR